MRSAARNGLNHWLKPCYDTSFEAEARIDMAMQWRRWRFLHVIHIPVILVLMLMVQTVAAGEQKGVFTGDYMGCKSHDYLVDYVEANQRGERAAAALLMSSKKCVSLKGRTYIPLRTGFVTSVVRLTYRGEDIVMWVRTIALRDSPPPPRDTHFNF